MAQRISRRDFAKRAVAGAASTTLIGKAMASPQETKKEDAPHQDLPHLNKLLPKPVPDELVKGVSAGLKHNDELAATRWKRKLPEGSEPQTVFSPTKAKGARK